MAMTMTMTMTATMILTMAGAQVKQEVLHYQLDFRGSLDDESRRPWPHHRAWMHTGRTLTLWTGRGPCRQSTKLDRRPYMTTTTTTLVSVSGIGLRHRHTCPRRQRTYRRHRHTCPRRQRTYRPRRHTYRRRRRMHHLRQRTYRPRLRTHQPRQRMRHLRQRTHRPRQYLHLHLYRLHFRQHTSFHGPMRPRKNARTGHMLPWRSGV